MDNRSDDQYKGKIENRQGFQQKSEVNKDKMKAFVKRKLKPVHQEIIAPPGQ